MSSWLRGHLTYANVVATLCLFLLLGGTALAAKGYLITSTKQIAPRVLKQLQGTRGAPGETGPVGPVGPVGATGAPGETPEFEEGEAEGSASALAVGYGSFEESVAAETTFTVTETAKVLARGEFEAKITCEGELAEPCHYRTELQIDGNRVGPARKQEFLNEPRSAPITQFDAVPATFTVGPGTHTVQLLDPITEPGLVEAAEPSVSVVALAP